MWKVLFREKENFFEINGGDIYLYDILGLEETRQDEEFLYSVFLPNEKQAKELQRDLRDKHNIKSELNMEPCTSADHWAEEWKKSYKPINLFNFVVVPPWLSDSTAKNKIIINPGLGFGTGRHESTQLALELILYALKEKNISTFLDVGTGSGLLSFAVAKEGIKTIKAIDICLDALSNAKKNAELNKMAYINFEHKPVENCGGEYDLVCANIISEILIKNYENIKKLPKEKSFLILSGIFYKYFDEVLSVYKQSFDIIKSNRKNDWRALLLVKKPL